MTSMRAARRFAIGFFVVYMAAVIYPGAVPFRGPRPFVFGLPFAMVWAAAWIVAAFFVLLLLDRSYSHSESAHEAAQRTPGGSAGLDPLPPSER